jgi:hypothetical protein
MQRKGLRLGSRGTVGIVALVIGCGGSSIQSGDANDKSTGAAGAHAASGPSSGGGTSFGGSPGAGAGSTNPGAAGTAPSGVMSNGGANSTISSGLAGQAAGGRAAGNAAGTGAAAMSGGGTGGNGNTAAAGNVGGAGTPNTAGTSGDGASVSDVPATWDTLKLVLTGTHPPCNSSICHNGNGKVSLGFPVANDDQLYSVLTQYVSMACDNLVLVVPGHPEQSALVKVLKGPCSDQVPRMPNGCTDADGNCVPDDYIAAVEQWITNGALRP